MKISSFYFGPGSPKNRFLRFFRIFFYEKMGRKSGNHEWNDPGITSETTRESALMPRYVAGIFRLRPRRPLCYAVESKLAVQRCGRIDKQAAHRSSSKAGGPLAAFQQRLLGRCGNTAIQAGSLAIPEIAISGKIAIFDFQDFFSQKFPENPENWFFVLPDPIFFLTTIYDKYFLYKPPFPSS